jgi:hypothetical protein
VSEGRETGPGPQVERTASKVGPCAGRLTGLFVGVALHIPWRLS